MQTQSSAAKTQGVSDPLLASPATDVHCLQYLDPIIAATWSEDGAVHDVCKALTPRFKEPNAIVRGPLSARSEPGWFTVYPGGLQGSHRFAHYDTQWGDR